MRQLSVETLNELMAEHQPPCVSLYMPTNRAFPGSVDDMNVFRDLMDRAQQELLKAHKPPEAKALMQPLRDLENTKEFWSHRTDGLAVFASRDLFLPLDVQRKIPAMVSVADSFHVKPLIRVMQTAGRYQVMCLTKRDVRLLEGNRDALDEVELSRNVPKNVFDAFSQENQAAGTPAKAQEGVISPERWFRAVDKAVWENHSRPSGLPLIVAALEETQTEFRRVSNNQNLVEGRIVLDPNHVPLQRLREEAWKIVEPYYHERTSRLIDEFHAAKARHFTSEDPRQIAEAATIGRISTLLVDADKQVGGKVDMASGVVTVGDVGDPHMDDLLDDAAETVIRTGGQVMVLPHDLMPTDTGAAAIYRY